MKCEACGQVELSDDPALIIIDGHTMKICDICHQLMCVIEMKINQSLNYDEKDQPL